MRQGLPPPPPPLPLLLLLAAAAGATHVFPVHRMLQYDLAAKGEPVAELGSRHSAVNRLAASAAAEDLTMKVAVLRMASVRADTLSELEGRAAAVLILMPPEGQEVSAAAEAAWLAVERAIVRVRVELPVYFAAETAELAAMHDELERGAAAGGPASGSSLSLSALHYQLVLNDTAEAKPIPPVRMANIQVAPPSSSHSPPPHSPLPQRTCVPRICLRLSESRRRRRWRARRRAWSRGCGAAAAVRTAGRPSRWWRTTTRSGSRPGWRPGRTRTAAGCLIHSPRPGRGTTLQ